MDKPSSRFWNRRHAGIGMFLFAFSFVFVVTAGGVKVVEADITTGLVGHWTMDVADIVNNIADSSGNSNNGSLILGSSGSTATTTAPGPIGEALSFDGVNDYVNVADASTLRVNTDMTISVWLKATIDGSAGHSMDIVTKGPDTILSELRFGTFSNSTNPSSISWAQGTESGYLSSTLYSHAPPNNYDKGIYNNVWGFFTVTRNDTTRTLKWYKDGVYINSTTYTASQVASSTRYALLMGKVNGQDSYYKGLMDDMRLYNRSLSDSDVAELYALGSGTDADAPSVNITSPLNVATVNSPITISASSTDAVGVAKVAFYYATSTLTLIGSSTAPVSGDIYQMAWTPSIATNGASSYTLYAVAQDLRPNYATSTITINVDVTKPVISNVTASSITQTGATITWNTDEYSDMSLEYGETSSLGSITTRDNATTTSHTFKFIYLKPQTTYYYRVTSRDQLGNTATSSIYSFTTLDADPAGSTENCTTASTGDTFYVSPTAVYGSGDGSCANPWNLYTALAHPAAVGAGDTIYLRGGLYRGNYKSTLTGTVGNPITVMSYPGEWARIDGYVYSFLTEDITASQTTIPLIDTSGFSPIGQGTDYSIHIGTIDPNSATGFSGVESTVGGGTSGNNLLLAGLGYRGWDGTTASAYPAGTIVRASMSALIVNGQDAIYRDFEIFNQDPMRSFEYYVTGDLVDGNGGWIGHRNGGVSITGPRNKIVNVIIHDTCDNGSSVAAAGSELYGVLIYGLGYVDTLRGHCHGLYMQNNDAANPQKVREVISFNNSATGMKAFGEQGYATGMQYDGVISFNNGSRNNFPGNPAGNISTDGTENLLIGTAVNAPSDDVVSNTYLYHKLTTRVLNLQFGYISTDSDNLTVTNNYIVGGSTGVSIKGWENMIFTGNAVIGQAISKLISAAATTTHNWTFNNNTYYDADSTNIAFGWSTPVDSGNANVSYNTWKSATGFDTNSTYTQALPTTNAVFVRPNIYETGRGNIAIYNWEDLSSVTVDISTTTLSDGDSYEVYNVQNASYDYPHGAIVASGYYNDASPYVSISMTDTGVAQPIGQMFTPESTLPQFGAFIIRKTASDTTVPQVALPSIVNGSATTSTMTLSATTTDNSGWIRGVTFWYDSTQIGSMITSTSSPDTYSTTFDSTSIPDGTYTFAAVSKDIAGNYATTTKTVVVDNIPVSVPTVSSSAASSLSTTVGTLNGSISTTGDENATQHGFAWGTSATLSGGDTATTTLGAKSGTGSFTSSLTGLTCATTYYARAYATNSAGTGYGDIVSFTTSACPAAEEPAAASSGSLSGTGRRNRILPGTTVSQPNQAITYVPTYPTIVYPGDPSSGVEVDSTLPLVTNTEPVYTPPSILSSLPGEFLALVKKFPSLGKTLSNIAVRSGEDVLDTLKSAKLSLPNLSRESNTTGIPLTSLTPLQKESLPEEVIFARSGDLIDYNVSLTVSDEGQAEQVIHTIAGKPIDLAIKPDKPVKSITGYLTIKKISRTQAMRAIAPSTSLGVNNSMLLASIGSLLAQNTEEAPVVDEKLVMSKFTYQDTDEDGIYTASITAPMIHGEYDIMTIMEYKDDKLGAKEFHLTTVVDPEGYVYEKISKTKQARVIDAKVTIYVKDVKTGQFIVWPADKFKQINPQKTDITGMYSFLVPEGTYKLTVTAPGYKDFNGAEFEVVQGSGIHENIELKKKGIISRIFGFIASIF